MKKWLMIGLVLVMAGVTYAQIPQQEISRLITSLVDWREQAVSPGVSFPSTCRTYWDTSGNFRYSCNGAAFATLGGGTVTGSGANTEIAVWTSAGNISGFTDFTWDDANQLLALGDTNAVGAFNNYIIGAFNDLSLSPGTGRSGGMGALNTVSDDDVWVIGEGNTIAAGGAGSIVSGFNNVVNDTDAVVFGRGNTSNGSSNNLLVGFSNESTGTSAALFGNFVSSSHLNATVIGSNTSSVADNSVSLGVSSTPEITITANLVELGQIGAASVVLQFDGSTSGSTSLKAGATPTPTTFTLPTADGTADSFLKTNGSGALGFIAPGKSQAYVVCTGVACATSCTLTFTKGLLTANSGTCP